MRRSRRVRRPAAARWDLWPPVLMIVDAVNLTLREQLRMPENLAGTLLNSARDTVYAISDSGLVILPVGSLNGAHRLAASREDIVFRGSFCDRQAGLQDVIVSHPRGGGTEFTVSTTTPGVSPSPASRNPAR